MISQEPGSNACGFGGKKMAGKFCPYICVKYPDTIISNDNFYFAVFLFGNDCYRWFVIADIFCMLFIY